MAIDYENRLESLKSDQEISSTRAESQEAELESESSELSTPTDSNSLDPSSDSDLDTWSLLFSTDESVHGDARDDDTPSDEPEDATGHSVNTLQGSMSLTLPRIDLHQNPAPVVKLPQKAVLGAFWNLKLLRLLVIFSLLAVLSILGVSQTLSSPNYVKIFPHFQEQDLADLTKAFRSPGSVSFDTGKKNWIALFATDDALVRATVPAELVDMDPATSISVKDFLQTVESKINLVCSDARCYSVVKHHEDRGVMDLKLVVKPDSSRFANHHHVKDIIGKFKSEPNGPHQKDLITINPTKTVSLYTETREVTEAIMHWVKEKLELAALGAYEVVVGVQSYARGFFQKGQAKLVGTSSEGEESVVETFYKVASARADCCLTKTKAVYVDAKSFASKLSSSVKSGCTNIDLKRLLKPVKCIDAVRSMHNCADRNWAMVSNKIQRWAVISGDNCRRTMNECCRTINEVYDSTKKAPSGALKLMTWLKDDCRTRKDKFCKKSKAFLTSAKGFWSTKLNRSRLAIMEPWNKVSSKDLQKPLKSSLKAADKARRGCSYSMASKHHSNGCKKAWKQVKCRWSTGRACPKVSKGYFERATKLANRFVH